MDGNISHGQKSKDHEWDFTFSSMRETVCDGDTGQTPSPLQTVHTLFFRGADVVKTIGLNLVKSLERIVP